MRQQSIVVLFLIALQLVRAVPLFNGDISAFRPWRRERKPSAFNGTTEVLNSLSSSSVQSEYSVVPSSSEFSWGVATTSSIAQETESETSSVQFEGINDASTRSTISGITTTSETTISISSIDYPTPGSDAVISSSGSLTVTLSSQETIQTTSSSSAMVMLSSLGGALGLPPSDMQHSHVSALGPTLETQSRSISLIPDEQPSSGTSTTAIFTERSTAISDSFTMIQSDPSLDTSFTEIDISSYPNSMILQTSTSLSLHLTSSNLDTPTEVSSDSLTGYSTSQFLKSTTTTTSNSYIISSPIAMSSETNELSTYSISSSEISTAAASATILTSSSSTIATKPVTSTGKPPITVVSTPKTLPVKTSSSSTTYAGSFSSGQSKYTFTGHIDVSSSATLPKESSTISSEAFSILTSTSSGSTSKLTTDQANPEPTTTKTYSTGRSQQSIPHVMVKSSSSEYSTRTLETSSIISNEHPVISQKFHTLSSKTSAPDIAYESISSSIEVPKIVSTEDAKTSSESTAHLSLIPSQGSFDSPSSTTNEVSNMDSSKTKTDHVVVSTTKIGNPISSTTVLSSFKATTTAVRTPVSETSAVSSITAEAGTTPTETLKTSNLNSYWWVPTDLLTQATGTNQGTATTPTASVTLPYAITPETYIPEPDDGYSAISIGFQRPLNYEFVVKNPKASAQIFAFLPQILNKAFNDTIAQVNVVQILPLRIDKADYIITIAEVYFPSHLIDTLEVLIKNRSSSLYNSSSTILKNMAILIDPSIPLQGLIKSSNTNGSNSGNGSSASTQDSSTKSNNCGSNCDSNLLGSLEWNAKQHSNINGIGDSGLNKKTVILVITLLFGCLAYACIMFMIITKYLKKNKASRVAKKSSSDMYSETSSNLSVFNNDEKLYDSRNSITPSTKVAMWIDYNYEEQNPRDEMEASKGNKKLKISKPIAVQNSLGWNEF